MAKEMISEVIFGIEYLILVMKSKKFEKRMFYGINVAILGL